MKAQIFRKFSVVLMLAAIPFFGGCDEEQANSAPVPAPSSDAVTNQPAPSASLDTNQVAPEETDEQLADAPGKIISTPDTGSTNVSNNPQLNDFVKLVQAGVGESVLMAYVTNSANAFNVTSDDILYLNDLGAPETVVSAMLQRDQHFNGNATAMTAAPQSQSQATYSTPPPAPAQEPVEAPAPPAPYPDTSVAAQAGYGTPPLTPPVEEDVQQAPNASYSYFYDSLSPYGNWVDIQGYGPCWQPTAGAGNPGWQPYCDRGHWAYTDCGWCWVSDYSWGWAPFHYGRWFRHNRFGWCWAPDTVWGPSWVSWRYNNNYCGWAPLPPTACYRPGFGFTYFGRPVGLNFEFNLSANRFLFVSLDHFHDRSPGRFRLDHREVNRIFNTTTINHQIIRGNNHTLINRGIPVERVAAATHTEIHPIHVRADADAPRSSQLGRDGRSLSIFRPALPTPKTAQAPRLVGEGVQRDTHFDLRSHAQQPATVTRTPVATPAPERRPIIPNTVRPSDNQARDNRTPQPSGERPGSLILRGPDRSTVNRDGNPARNDSPNLRRDPGFQGQQNLPADNNRRTLTPTAQQPDRPAPQPLLPPSFNRQDNQMRRDDLQQQQQQRQLLQQQQRDVQQQQQQFQQQQQQQQRALQQQQRESEHQQRYFQQQQQQQPMVPVPRQEAPRSFDMPRGDNNQNFNPGYRSAPAPEVHSAPTMPQFAPPARESRQDSGGGGNGGGQGRGNGGGGGNNGSGNGNGGGNGNGNGRGNR